VSSPIHLSKNCCLLSPNFGLGIGISTYSISRHTLSQYLAGNKKKVQKVLHNCICLL